MDIQTDKKSIKKRNRSWLNILLIIIPYFIIVGIFQLIGYTIIEVDFLHTNVDVILTTQQHFITSLFEFIGTFIVLGIFMRYLDRERFIRMGFHIKNRGKDILLGIFLGLFIMGFFYFLLIELNEIFYLNTTFNLSEFSYFILICIFISFSEEMLFRGYVLRNLMYSFNKYVAV